MSVRRAGIRAVFVVALAAGLTLPAGPAGAATIATFPRFGDFAIDHVYERIFVALGEDNAVSVLNFDGTRIALIPDVPMASGIAIAGSKVYVARYGRPAIDVIDRQRLVRVKILRLPFNTSGVVAYARGRLWTTGSHCHAHSNLVSINPATGRARARSVAIYCALIKTSPVHPNWLFIAERGLSPGRVYIVDISRPRARVVHEFPDDLSASNMADLAISDDGRRLFTAHGSPYHISEFSIAQRRPTGLTYPTGAYPTAVDFTDAGRGYVAAGINDQSTNLRVFPQGSTTPAASYDVGDEVSRHSMHIAPTAGRIFAMEWPYDGESPFKLHSVAAPASGELSRISLHASRRTIDSGDTVRLTGAVGAHPSSNDSVELHAQPLGRRGRRIATDTVDGDGRFSFTVRPGVYTTYVVRWAGDATHLTAVSPPITVRLRLVTSLRTYGGYKTEGRYRYFHLDRRAPMVATTSPKQPGRSMLFRVQKRRDGAWELYETARLRIPRDGTLEAAFATRHPGSYRIRAEYSSFEFSGDVSGWRYLRMTQ